MLNQTTNFGMTIKVDGTNNFHKKYFQKNISKVDLEDEKMVISGGGVGTMGVASCTAYLMKYITGTKLYHYSREPHTLISDAKGALDIAKSSLIFGGDIEALKEPFNITYKEIHKKQNVPTSIFWGQNNTYSNGVYDEKNDIFHLCIQNFNPKNGIEELKKTFNIINIAKGDELYIGTSKIKSQDANQNNLEYTI